MLIPKDPDDDKNVIMEIRAGAGGDEAAILREIYTGCMNDTSITKAGERLDFLERSFFWWF